MKVRFCCLINLLAVNLLVCYEIKVNSDEAIKEYFGGQRVGTVIPSLCTGHGRGAVPVGCWQEMKSSFHSCSVSFVPVLVASHQAQVVGAVSVWIRLIPGP